MRRLLLFLFLVAVVVVSLVQFGFLRRSNSSWIGLRVSNGAREPSLSEIIGPIYQAVFRQNDLKPVMNTSASVNNLQSALADAGPGEAANSARRLCGIMQATVAHAGEMEERRNRNAAVPHSNMTPGDIQKAGNFFSDVIKRDWRTRYSEFQASAAREWAKIQSLEEAGDRPYIDSSAFPTPAPE